MANRRTRTSPPPPHRHSDRTGDPPTIGGRIDFVTTHGPLADLSDDELTRYLQEQQQA